MSLVVRNSAWKVATYDQSPSPSQSGSPKADSPSCVDTALEAYQQGLMGLHYIDDGWKQTVTYEKIPALISKGFTLQLATNGKFYFRRGLLGGAPKEFISTQVLAEELKKADLNHPDYAGMQELALNVINLFAQNQTKTKPLIEEVTALAYANNSVITRSLLKVLIKEINQGELLDIDLLKALKTTLINSWIDALDPDDLIHVLQITMRRITQIHQQDRSNYKLYAGISTISDILDVMGDANVIKVGRIDIHDPLYKILDRLSDGDDTLIAAQAAYAKQSLVRVPNDETKFRSMLRRGISLAKGVASLYKVITDKDLSSILSAYDNFKQAINFQEEKKHWYGDIRILKLLSEKRNYDLFIKVMDTNIKDSSNAHIVGNILCILQDVANNNPDFNAKKWALDRMADLFLNDSKWGDKKQVKKSILAQIMGCVALQDQATANHAKVVLTSIGARENLTKQQARLIEDTLEDLPNVTPKTVHHVDAPSTSLITAAKHSKIVSVEEKIEKLKEQALQDEDVLKDLASYIPVLGSRCLFDPKEQTIDLDGTLSEFLKSDHKVFLLLGDSGGGKSTYLRFLENRLWNEWQPGKPIPLFISLPALKLPFKDAINEVLGKRGFTESEQRELKSQHSFVFLLDGYDELKQKKNLYIANQLNQWKAQTIITCRTQYLSGEQSSYQNYFAPPADNFISSASLDEASTSPFTSKQIEDYCRKFIELNNIPKTWEQYQSDIASVPDLVELIETPFLLRIIAEVLPSIIEKHKHSKSQEQLRLLRIEIFDAFVRSWFNREELKLQQRDIEHNIPDIKKAYADFATRLALEMLHEGIVSVEYEESSSLFDQTSSKWAKYFSSDSKTILVRSGVPLRKIGANSYVFVHKSLLEYFSARAICAFNPVQPKLEEMKAVVPQKAAAALPSSNPAQPASLSSSSSSSSADMVTHAESLPTAAAFVSTHSSAISYENLNQKILTQELEIIRLLSECVTKDPSLISQLFEFVKRSKHDPQASIAAANAMTILITAGVNLSRCNLEGVRIAGADLSGAILTNTNLSHADLRNVRLKDANLDHSTIAFSETEGIDLGQRPLIKTSTLECTALSPDGKTVLSSGDNDIHLWDCQTGKKVRSFVGHTKSITSVAFSPDGKQVLSVDCDGSVRLWDYQTGQEIRSFSVDRKNYTGHCVAFSPDGKRVLSGAGSLKVHMWDWQSGNEIQSFVARGQPSITSSPDDKGLFFSEDKDVRLCDCETGKELQSFLGHTDSVNSVAFLPEAKWVLSGSNDKTVRLWDYETGKEIRSFTGHTDDVTSVAFSPDGKCALSGSRDKSVRLWDCQTGKELRCFLGHTHYVTSVAISPEGWAFSGSEDGTIRIWDISLSSNHKIKRALTESVSNFSITQDGKLEISLDFYRRLWNFKTDDSVKRISFSPDRKLALIGFRDDTFSLWDCETGKKLQCFTRHPSQITEDFSPDGTWILSGGIDKTVRLWDLQTGKELRIFLGHSALVESVAFSPDGKRALSGSRDGTVCLWDCHTGKQLHHLKELQLKNLSEVAFSPGGRWVYSRDSDCRVRVCDSQTGYRKLRSFFGHDDRFRLDFSPDDRWAFCQTDNSTATLWDCHANKVIKSFGGSGSVTHAFSPNGKWILIANKEGINGETSISLLDCETGKEVRSFGKSLYGNIESNAFSSDNKWALSLEGDGSKTLIFERLSSWEVDGCKTVILWDCQTGQQIGYLTLSYFVDALEFYPDGRSILVSTNQPAFQKWELFDGNNNFKPSLKWTTNSMSLSAQRLNMEGVKNLSESNNRLLLQHGAVDISKQIVQVTKE